LISDKDDAIGQISEMVDNKLAEGDVPQDALEIMKQNKERWNVLKLKVN
jgi:hypothetical protein